MTIKPFALMTGILALAACGDNTPNPAALKGANFISQQPGANITLSFAADEMRVNGQVVNLYNGTYTVNGDKIQFGPLASTMMMGPMDAMQTEQDYFQFMATVDSYDLKGGRLTLKNNAGKEIVFQQIETIPDAIEEVESVEVIEVQPAQQ